MKSVLISMQPKWCELIANGKKTVEVRKTRPKFETPFKCYIYETKGKFKTSFVWDNADGLTPIPNGAKVTSISNTLRKVEYTAQGKGKVIGEFICDRIDKFESEFWGDDDYMSESSAMEQIRKSYYADPDDRECEEEFEYITGNEKDNPDDCELCRQSCLTYSEIRKYIGIGDKVFYGLHISNLKIYDKPKRLNEFRTTVDCFNLANINFTKNALGEWVGQYAENSFCRACGHIDDFGGCGNTEHILTRPPQSWCYVDSI